MPVDRKAFFDGYRAAFGKLRQRQVDGLNLLLQYIEDDEQIDDVRWAAYMLATVKHECADTWQPIVERGPKSYFKKYDPGTAIGKRLGNVKPGDGYLFRGRGYVQITGRANYARMSEWVEDYIEVDPDLALNPNVAYEIMSVGMRGGLFTGKSLGHYINASGCDYGSARRIVNGLDQSERIAGYAEQLERILQGAQN